MLKENATTYRRVTRIEHPEADDIYTVFHLATKADEPVLLDKLGYGV